MTNEFFTLSSLGTLAGATGATVAVTNGLRTALNLRAPWVGLVVPEIVCLGVLFASGPTASADWFIAMLNGFLVFATSAGASAAGASAKRRPAPTKIRKAPTGGLGLHEELPASEMPDAAAPTPFWSSWF